MVVDIFFEKARVISTDVGAVVVELVVDANVVVEMSDEDLPVDVVFPNNMVNREAVADLGVDVIKVDGENFEIRLAVVFITLGVIVDGFVVASLILDCD